MSAEVLRDRDVNSQMAESKQNESTKTHIDTSERLRKDDQSEQKQSYVSPSDAIMSPASKKLSDFKQKQISRRSNAPMQRALFAKAVSGRQKDLGPK